MKIAKLHFTESNPPSNDDSLQYDIIIETDMNQFELQSIIDAIASIKEHADMGESISDFIIPDGWDSYGWDEKIKIAAEYLSGYTGLKFRTVDAICVQVSVN
jgi:hypothetical protein